MTENIYPKQTTSAFGMSSSPDFPALEKDVLKFWNDNNIFQESIDNREAGKNGENEFVFYDGPPFANGLPHLSLIHI